MRWDAWQGARVTWLNADDRSEAKWLPKFKKHIPRIVLILHALEQGEQAANLPLFTSIAWRPCWWNLGMRSWSRRRSRRKRADWRRQG